MQRITFTLVGCWLLLALCAPHSAERKVRVATYNIKWLSSRTTRCGDIRVYDVRSQGRRLQRLRQLVELLDADIIGLQEIRDREALELIFDNQDDEWTLVIDDESEDCQNLALAVRAPLAVRGASGGKLNASAEHFLFESEDSLWFPGARDVLCAEVLLPNQLGSLYVMVHHAKARSGGRSTTNHRRVGAARRIIAALERDFDEKRFVLVGDFNDNPDDASLNVLETGRANAPAAIEDEAGALLINLAEPLAARDHVSHGRASDNVRDGRIDTVEPGSRQRNFELRHNDGFVGDTLFDQVLVCKQVYDSYVRDSAAVFNLPVAVEGSSYRTASDHLPVYADFLFGGVSEPTDGGVRIVALLPNPAGRDAGNEKIVLKNFGESRIDLSGWSFRDSAGNAYALRGEISIERGAKLTIQMESFTMPLNNNGDEVALLDATGITVHKVRYTGGQVRNGAMIRLED